MDKKEAYKLSAEIRKRAEKKDPQVMAVFLYHIVKTNPKTPLAQNPMNYIQATETMLLKKYGWTMPQTAEFVRKFNELNQYAKNKG